MERCPVVRKLRVLVPLVALAGISLMSRPAVAQGQNNLRNTSLLGIGYVANIPNAFLGFSAIGMTPKLFGGAGLYVDFKTSTTNTRNDPFYYADVTISDAELQYGDMLYDEKSEWLSFNAALVYAVTYDFAIYGGAGYSRERHYREYFDDAQDRGDFGFYWIPDPEASGNRVNVLGGIMFRLAKLVMFQLGGETEPAGATVGVVIAFPL